MRDVLSAAIKAHEIQGGYALKNSFNRVGLDHVILVRLASTAVATHMLGGGKDEIINAVSHSWIDGGALRTYRHAPNAGPRKSWAAGDACRRAVTHALNAVKGCVGYPSALTRQDLGLLRRAVQGQGLRVRAPVRQLRHGKRAVQDQLSRPSSTPRRRSSARCSCTRKVAGRLDQIDRIEVETQEAGVRIIDKTGPLANYADRDHCLQYMVAVPLIFGRLTADDYADGIAADPRIDALRARMEVKENPQFTQDYFDPDKRYIGNSIEVLFKDGTSTGKVSIDYPIGHRNRRGEGVPVLLQKFADALGGHLPGHRVKQILDLTQDTSRFESTPIHRFLDLFVV